MAKYFIFIFIFSTIVFEFGHTAITDKKVKRSDISLNDVVQQMFAEQIERKKILKSFKEMKNELSEVKQKLKDRNTLMQDTKLLQKKLSGKVKIMMKEAKDEIQKHGKLIQAEISNTKKSVSELDQKYAYQNELLWKEMKNLKNSTSYGEKVAFTVWLHRDLKTSSAIVFGKVMENIGGGYNSSDGIFYCPKAGIYMFSATLKAYYKHNVYGILKKNNKIVAQLGNIIGGVYTTQTTSSTVVVRLAYGDKVYVQGTDIRYRASFSSFTGFLIKS